jgi:hypothetical protein
MKIKKLYYGFWTNGNSYNRDPIEGTNLAKLKKTMRQIAYGNDTGSGARWWIQDELTYRGHEYPVAEGKV